MEHKKVKLMLALAAFMILFSCAVNVRVFELDIDNSSVRSIVNAVNRTDWMCKPEVEELRPCKNGRFGVPDGSLCVIATQGANDEEAVNRYWYVVGVQNGKADVYEKKRGPIDQNGSGDYFGIVSGCPR